MINWNQLPFRLYLDRFADSIRGDLQILLTSKCTSEPDLLPSAEMVEVFAVAAAAQYFLIPGVRTQCSKYRVERCVDGSYDCLLRVDHLRSDSLVVLCALLAQTVHAGDELEEVRILLRSPKSDGFSSCEAASDPRWLGDPFERVRLPSFPVIGIHDLRIPGPLDVRFEFVESIGADAATAIGQQLELWGFLGAMGGFDLSFTETEDFVPEFGLTSHIESSVIEYSVDRFHGPPQAINLLLNFAEGISAAGVQVARLDFGQ